jgi:hypothetical protein
MADEPESDSFMRAYADSLAKPSTKDIWASVLAKSLASSSPFAGSLLATLIELRKKEQPPAKPGEKPRTMAEEKVALVKELIESGIDPAAFDVLISNEINRRLKIQFGVAFLVLTVLFIAASYSIVILDGIHQWKISQVAITALIIETPIQFIGLLYIIARNLFPQRREGDSLTNMFRGQNRIPRTNTEPRAEGDGGSACGSTTAP